MGKRKKAIEKQKKNLERAKSRNSQRRVLYSRQGYEGHVGPKMARKWQRQHMSELERAGIEERKKKRRKTV